MALSIQDQALNLIVKKGMTQKDAITEIESVLHGQLPDNIKASIRDHVDMYYYHQARRNDGQIKDLSGKCYFCEMPVGEAYYCYGCGFWVCNECSSRQPVGTHNVREHYCS